MTADEGAHGHGHRASVNGAFSGSLGGVSSSRSRISGLSAVGGVQRSDSDELTKESWSILERVLQSRDSFEQCGPVLDGAVDLIVRTALVRGGLAERQRNALVHAVGVERLVRIVDHLASYEAVAIVEALPAYAQRGVNRNGALARQRLAAIVQAAGRPQTDRTPTDREATVAKDGAAAREQTASAPAVQAAVSAGASSPVARAATPPPAGERVFYSMRFKRAISPPDKT